MSDETLMTVADVAKELSVSKKTVYRITESGDLPHLRLGRSLRYEPVEVRHYKQRKSIGKSDGRTSVITSWRERTCRTATTETSTSSFVEDSTTLRYGQLDAGVGISGWSTFGYRHVDDKADDKAERKIRLIP